MYMLSEVLRFRVRDATSRQARLRDLAIDLRDADHPPVTALILGHRGAGRSHLPWGAVQRVDVGRRELVVADVTAGATVDDQSLAGAVLLKRDVRDALVLDAQHCVAARVNDVSLNVVNGSLVVQAADFSPGAVLRWMAHWLAGRIGPGGLVDWAHLEFLRGDPTAARREGDVHRIERLRPPEIARLVDALPYLHAAELLALTPEPTAADALEIMTRERQIQVLEELDQPRGARLLELMAPDTAADLLGWIEPELAGRYLELMPEARRNQLVVLLGFPPGSAGGIMTNDLITVPCDLTILQARERLHESLRRPDVVYYVYVVEAAESDRLVGVLTLRDLLVADEARTVQDVMLRDPASVDPLESADEAARRLADSELAAIPVVGSSRKLLGVITFDVALAQLAPSSRRDQAPRLFS